MNVLRKKSVEQTLAETEESGRSLKRDLTWWDLAIMGVAVAVGAGIFSIGAQAAAFHAGPAVIISFLIAGVVCGAAVMCYAEFASMIPVAGSAYTFTYTTVGEIVAWVIGWDLILEMLMAGSPNIGASISTISSDLSDGISIPTSPSDHSISISRQSSS